jgi:hypothetical protein
MKSRILSVFALAILLASCSSAYRQAQTPDDVYYSPAKGKEKVYASANDKSQSDNYAHHNNNNYEDYTSSNEDAYLRMKIQDRYRWSALDDYDYWYSPNYAFNNYYGYNSFNPFLFNSWGLSFYYSPFASIQPYGWFNSFYPTYGYYTPYSGYFGHNYGYSYMPVYLTNVKTSPGVHRPLLGGYVNTGAGYNNNNNRSRNLGRYIPSFNSGNSKYSNRNSNFNNNNSFSRPSSGNNNSAPVRSFTPSSGGSSSSGGGGGVTRQPRR